MKNVSLESIFDSHIHILPKGRLKGLMRWIHKSMPGHPVPEEITAEQIRGQLNDFGIGNCFNLVYPIFAEETEHINKWNLEFCSNTSHIHPVCSLHIDTPDKEKTAETLFREGSMGIKFHPHIQKFNPADEAFSSLYKHMNKMKMPLFLHTGYDAWYGSSFPVEDIEAIISKHPDMPVVIVHMIFPQIKEAFTLLESYSNVILDGTNVPGSFIYAENKNIPLDSNLIDALTAGIENNSTRIMYGSDHPVGMGSLDTIYNDLKNLNLSSQVLSDITNNTASSFLQNIREEQKIIS